MTDAAVIEKTTAATDLHTQEVESVAVTLQGHLDALEENRIHGWAWNPSNPGERLLIDILDAGEGVVIATGIADQTRSDLVESKIGDGFYAFAIDVKGVFGLRDTGRLRVVARRLQGNERIDLPIPAVIPADNKVASGNRILEAEVVVQELRERDKRLWGGLRQLAQVTQNNNKSPQEVINAAQQLEAVATRVEKTLTDFTKQNGGYDTLHLRFDKMLSDFDKRIKAVEESRQVLSTTTLMTWAIVTTMTSIVLAALLVIIR